MQARDADAFFRAVEVDFDPAAGRQWQLVLRYLITLGKVWVKIIFAGEAGMLVHRAVQRQRGTGSHFDYPLVQHRQGAGKAETDGTSVGVGRVAEARGATAENFGVGQQLDVDFQADDRLVFREQVGRDAGRVWSRFRHGEQKL